MYIGSETGGKMGPKLGRPMSQDPDEKTNIRSAKKYKFPVPMGINKTAFQSIRVRKRV